MFPVLLAGFKQLEVEVKAVLLGSFLLLAAFAELPVASAQERSITAEVAVYSDYIVQGYSRSESDPVLQAGFQYRHKTGFIGGLWGSSVRFDFDDRAENRRRLELRPFVGYSARPGKPWSWDALVVRYEHPDADAVVDTSYTEGSLSVHYRELFSATVAYTDDLFGHGASGRFAEVTGGYPLPYGIDLSSGIGQADIRSATGLQYFYGHVALSRPFGRFRVNIGYYDSDAPRIPIWGEVADGRWVAGLSFGDR